MSILLRLKRKIVHLKPRKNKVLLFTVVTKYFTVVPDNKFDYHVSGHDWGVTVNHWRVH